MDGGRHTARAGPRAKADGTTRPSARPERTAAAPTAAAARRLPGAPARRTSERRPKQPSSLGKPRSPAAPCTLAAVTAIIGGLGAALLWAIATLCSSRSSRMLGSRVVLAWIMIVGVVVGVPIAAVSPASGLARAFDARIAPDRRRLLRDRTPDHVRRPQGGQGQHRRPDRRDRGRDRRGHRRVVRRFTERRRSADARRHRGRCGALDARTGP